MLEQGVVEEEAQVMRQDMVRIYKAAQAMVVFEKEDILKTAGITKQQLNASMVVLKRKSNEYRRCVLDRVPMDYSRLLGDVEELCTRLQSVKLRYRAEKPAAVGSSY